MDPYVDLQEAIRYGNEPRVVELLANEEIDINLPIYNGWTPLLFACWCYEKSSYCNYSILEHLLLAGADPNLTEPRTFLTPLHRACKGRKAKMVRLLLRYGADTRVVDNLGRTPLYYATFNEWIDTPNEEIIDLLEHPGNDIKEPECI